MNHKKFLMALAFVVNAGVGSTANAELLVRGDDFLYDDVLDITWLRDANYAATLGYVPPNIQQVDSGAPAGAMSWDNANAWAAELSYQGITGWRLATTMPINVDLSVTSSGSITPQDYLMSYSFDGTTDKGQRITSSNSELAYMFNVNLGGLTSTGFANLANFNLIQNLQYTKDVNPLTPFGYWSSTIHPTNDQQAFEFSTSRPATQSTLLNDIQLYAWAVHDGDIAPIPTVPLPAAAWLFLAGFMGILYSVKPKGLALGYEC